MSEAARQEQYRSVGAASHPRGASKTWVRTTSSFDRQLSAQLLLSFEETFCLFSVQNASRAIADRFDMGSMAARQLVARKT